MSTPDNPESGQLTRRQMRQQRTTGAHPVIGAQTAVATQEPPAPPTPKAPLPRAARPVAVAPAPMPDSAVDLGVSPLTRRQARQQERIRTASVPVITPEVAAAHSYAPVFTPPAVVPQPESVLWTPAVAEERAATGANEVVAGPTDATRLEDLLASPADAPAETVAMPEVELEDELAQEPEGDETEAVADSTGGAPRIDARFGENLLAVDEPADAKSVSFDDLLAKGGTGSNSTPHALILSHVPEASPLSAVTSTGEVIVTGIYNLPEGLGSQGHAIGAADGKEVDAILVDGELPASSSPTPIAASSAISTVRGTGEIIRPPAPEKSNRLMLTLMITAGVLALSLVGLLVYVVASGVFN